VAWFRGSKRRDRSDKPISLNKPESRTEAEQAVRESAARMNQVQQQRGVVIRLVDSLAEVRQENNFSEKIRAAMGGGTE
jgi:hypothetical protein